MSCLCPAGFTINPTNDGCIKIEDSLTTLVGSLLPVSVATTFGGANTFGTIFYEDITESNGIVWPIKLTANTSNFQTQNGTPLYDTSTWVDSNGRILNIRLGGCGGGSPLSCSNLSVPLYGPQKFNTGVWGSKGSTTQVWPTNTIPAPPFNEWIGFSVCLDYPTNNTFYIGLVGDDVFRLSLNGKLVVQSSGLTTNSIVSTCAHGNYNFGSLAYHVFPIYLTSGLNVLHIEGYSTGSTSGLGCEIYSATSFSVLTAATTSMTLSGLTIFSTINKIGSNFDIGETSGYTCSSPSYFVDCGSPKCTEVQKTGCTNTTPSVVTITTTRPYLRLGYIPVNDCNVLTIYPLDVQCVVTNVTGKQTESNGAITLDIVGGTPPYVVRWVYPSGAIRVSGPNINNLSVGVYTATVTDYFGDYQFTTSCQVFGPTPTTTTTTTLPPIPSYETNVFCMTVTRGRASIQELTFQLNDKINGVDSWTTAINTIPPIYNEGIFYDTSFSPSPIPWSLSATSVSSLNSPQLLNGQWPSWQILNYGSNPPNFQNWQVISSQPGVTVTTALGACSNYLLLTINEWWGLNNGEIPNTYKFSGGSCTGSNETPWFKWYLFGLNSSDISSYEIFASVIDSVTPYITWDVSNIDNTQTEVSNSIPWIGTPNINSTTGSGENSQGWQGPCPPSGQTLRYIVSLSANLVAGGGLTSSVTFYSTTP
jgi:hypothetical protein